MQFENMREFVVLTETRNYLEASERLYISQATLSRHIMAMEKELGERLFDRSTRKVQLTLFGARFLPYARKAIALQEEYLSMVEQEQRMEKDTISIGAFDNWNKYPIQAMMENFQKEKKTVHIDFQTLKNCRIVEEVKADKIHVAFVRERETGSRDGIDRITLFEDSFVIYMPETHPMACKESLTAEQLRNEIFLLPEKNSIAYQLCNEICEAVGFQPQYFFKGLESADLFRMIKENMGIAILAAPNGRPVQMSGIAGVRLDSNIHTYVNLIHKEKQGNALVRDFAKYCSYYVFEEIHNS